MNSGILYFLLVARAKVHDNIDRAAAQAMADIATLATQCRRAMGQRFRKLNRDIYTK